MIRPPWTAREIAIVRNLYPDTPTAQLAKRLGRSVSTVYQRAQQLGLHKSAAYLASPAACRLRHGDNVGAARRFPKGNVPWNKGRHYVAGGRSAETRFRKGQWPVNKDHDFYVLGALRVNADGYIEMRTSFHPGSSGWTALHRILWVDAHGPVPRGHALRFRDGDKLNVELANLELISRADLCRRNSVHNLPLPLRSTIQVLGQLKRRIRERAET
jgi:hypothetical protein